jgi:Tol biopolymer transport system component
MSTSQGIFRGGICVLLGSTALAQVTQRVSVAANGAEENGFVLQCSISADGRFVAFMSDATNLVPLDTNDSYDAFVRDRLKGTTERVSVATGGGQGNGWSGEASISADGRYVAFQSTASNLVDGDTNGTSDIFVRDRVNRTTDRVSVATGGVQANDYSGEYPPSISAGGRYVAFVSVASNLVPGDTNGYQDVFVRDRASGTTERVSVDSMGGEADGPSGTISISADGRYVAFRSDATNLIPVDTNWYRDVFVHDRTTGTTERVSVGTGGVEAMDTSGFPSISADGRYVAFLSPANNLVAGGGNGRIHVFVRDRQAGTTERVSISSGGAQANNDSYGPAISPGGRYVGFSNPASNLVLGDTNDFFDVFVHDRASGTTERVSVASDGTQANGASFFMPAISDDGHFVAFRSNATNLVPGDTNGSDDVFVRDRVGGPSFTSLCEPGVAGVIGCPCGNPPSGPGRGCDNSSSTGGATLSASGGTYLSSDSLVFTTSGEKPAALSIVLQGNQLIATGVVYGQGVRCMGGVLKRLYVKSAAGGGITVPNFDAGDSSVSERSRTLGDPIQLGQERRYLVYYRDPIVLGGCLATSTFNATQTGEVAWSP